MSIFSDSELEELCTIRDRQRIDFFGGNINTGTRMRMARDSAYKKIIADLTKIESEMKKRKKIAGDISLESLRSLPIDELDIFNITADDIDKYFRTDVAWREKHTDVRVHWIYDPYKIVKDMSMRLVVFFEKCSPEQKDAFFEKVLLNVKRYAKSAHTDIEQNAQESLEFHRLSAILSSPIFIIDKHAVSILENLADYIDDYDKPGTLIRYPWNSELYDKWANDDPDDDRRILVEGIGKDSIICFEKMIDSERLWRTRYMREGFFSSVTAAIGLLSIQYPNETLSARLKLLRKSVELSPYPDGSGAGGRLSSIVRTFETSKDREALSAIVAEEHGSKLALVAEEILTEILKRDSV